MSMKQTRILQMKFETCGSRRQSFGCQLRGTVGEKMQKYEGQNKRQLLRLKVMLVMEKGLGQDTCKGDTTMKENKQILTAENKRAPREA